MDNTIKNLILDWLYETSSYKVVTKELTRKILSSNRETNHKTLSIVLPPTPEAEVPSVNKNDERLFSLESKVLENLSKYKLLEFSISLSEERTKNIPDYSTTFTVKINNLEQLESFYNAMLLPEDKLNDLIRRNIPKYIPIFEFRIIDEDHAMVFDVNNNIDFPMKRSEIQYCLCKDLFSGKKKKYKTIDLSDEYTKENVDEPKGSRAFEQASRHLNRKIQAKYQIEGELIKYSNEKFWLNSSFQTRLKIKH